MKKNKQELKSILFELSTPEERARLAAQGIDDLLSKFNKLYNDFSQAISSRDIEYGAALELLIRETDKRVKEYISDVEKNTDSKMSKVNGLISQLEMLADSADSDLQNQLESARDELKAFKKSIENTYELYRTETKDLFAESKRLVSSLENKTEASLEELNKFKAEFITRMSKLASLEGGGAPHRRIQINGTTVATRYADINYVVTGWTATNDDTNKVTTITIAAASGKTLTAETPTGAVDDSNTTFTVANEPVYIVVNGGQYTVGTGMYSTYSSGTITLSAPIGTGGFIRSFYNA